MWRERRPVCLTRAPGPHFRLPGRERAQGALPPAPRKGGPPPRPRAEEPLAFAGGGGRLPRGAWGAKWGTGRHWPRLGVVSPDSWRWQQPGLPGRLSPDTRGPATQKPGPDRLALDRGSWSGTRCLFRAWGGGGWSQAGRAPLSAGWQSHQGGRPGLEGFFKEEILLNMSDVPSGSLPPSCGSCGPYLWSPGSPAGMAS